jgi:hypothetical protein
MLLSAMLVWVTPWMTMRRRSSLLWATPSMTVR